MMKELQMNTEHIILQDKSLTAFLLMLFLNRNEMGFSK